MAIRRVCVFCGSRDGAKPVYREAATAMGRAIGRHGLELVYGGAQNGLMGALADGVLEQGQAVVGVIPHGLAHREFAHPRLTHAHYVDSMHERKALMERLSDAFIALPGGFGTMDELFEALTWSQLGLHAKPVALLDTDGFYDPLLEWVRRGVSEGFVPESLESSLLVEADPEALLTRLLALRLPDRPPRWSAPRP